MAQTDNTALPIERVVLSTAGVAYYQHGGTVDGDAAVTLDFTPPQLNDLLKSLIAQDLDGGSVSAIDYPGSEPLTRLLGELSIDLSSNRSLSELFVQLRGAGANLLLDGGEKLGGRILGIENRQQAAGQSAIDVAFVSIAGSDGIRTADINTIRRFELTDKRLQEQLNKALNVLAESGNNDKKPVSVHFSGNGKRRVALGYVVEAPLWKTSYRLSLPAADSSDSAMLQGWAIVENNTANDWRNVELALVSGRPLSFIEDLYESQYLSRPVHTPQRFAGIGPQTYATGMNEDMAVAEAAPPPERMMARMATAAGAMPKPVFDSKAKLDFASSVSVTADTENLGATFQYAIPSVSLPSRRSAMLPIVNEKMDIQRLSIYDRNTLPNHPLHGVRLINTTGKHLPGGPLTVFEGSGYAGDARIDDLPAGGNKLLSFAIDLDLTVQQQNPVHDSVLQNARIESSVLFLQQVRSRVTVYTIKNDGSDDREMLLAHPFERGWALNDTPEPVERTENQYRFSVLLPAGKTREFKVQEQRTDWERSRIADFSEESLLDWTANTRLPQTVRDSLAHTAELRRAIASAEQAVKAPQQRIAEITAEQERIRANLATLQKGIPLYDRLIKRLDTQETELENLQKTLSEARETQRAAQKKLNDYLAALNAG